MSISPTWRERAALVVLFVAGLAGLATSFPATVERSIEGAAALEAAGALVEVDLLLGPDHAESNDRLEITLQHVALGGAPGSAAMAGRLQVGDPPLAESDWGSLPITLAIRTRDCPNVDRCVVPLRAWLRSTGADGLPATVRWRVDAVLYGIREAGFELVHAGRAAAVSLLPLAIGSFSTGALGAAALAVAYRRAPRERRLRLLERSPLVLLWLGAVVLAQGALMQGLASVATLVALVAAALPSFLNLERTEARGHVLAVGLLGPPVMLAALANDGAFRPTDVVIWFAGAGATLVTGAALFIATVSPQTRRQVRATLAASRGVVLVSVFLLLLIGGWMIAVAGGMTRYTGHYLMPVVPAFGFLLWGLWRWLRGDAILLLIVGLLLPVLAVLGFMAGALLTFPRSSSDPAAAVSLAAIALASLVLLFGMALNRWPGGPSTHQRSSARRSSGRSKL